MKNKKVKDLPKGTNMDGIKVRIPKGHPECPFKEGYWRSQWGYEDGKAGVWITKEPGDNRIYPVFLDSLKECLEWEIIEEK